MLLIVGTETLSPAASSRHDSGVSDANALTKTRSFLLHLPSNSCEYLIILLIEISEHFYSVSSSMHHGRVSNANEHLIVSY